MTVMSSTESISSVFANARLLVQPSTVEYIEEKSDKPIQFAQAVVESIDDDVSTVTKEEIENLNISVETEQEDASEEEDAVEDDAETDSVGETQEETEPVEKEDAETEDEEASTADKQEGGEDEEPESSTDSETQDESENENSEPISVEPNPTSEAAEDVIVEDETPENLYEDASEEEVTLEDIGVYEAETEVAPRSGEATVDVVKDVTGQSTGTGEYGDFAKLFTDRYEKLKNILSQRVSSVPIEALEKSGGKKVTIIGRVLEARTTQNNNRLVILEDRTGEFPAVFTDEKEQKLTEEILEGEVIAIEGEVAGNGEILFGNSILLPEVPPRNKPTKADRSVKAAFISDIHLGADTFASECWNEFVSWIRQQEEIEYLFVAGDVIEGIGVYPGQEDILTVVDMYQQYDLCGEAFSQFPDDLEIIVCTGNHDMVRLAEPQPALPDKFTGEFPENVTFTGNPATIEIENGINVEFYHGMSINGFTDTIPSADVMNPTTAMKHMLKKRHLAPLYGYNTRIAPEKEDYLVLEEIPDVLHSGHVHTFGTDTYNGVSVLNTGAWQYQTDFQEKMNIVPTVANVGILDLETFQTEVKDFS